MVRTTARRLAVATPGRALLAGIAGTLVLGAFELLEWRVLGRRPVYAPSSIVARLLHPRAPVSFRALELAGRALRAVYGPALAVAWFGGGRARTSSTTGEGLRAGVAIYLFELVAMPAAGATPALGAWRRQELLALLAHTLAFGLATSAAYTVLSSAAPGRRK